MVYNQLTSREKHHMAVLLIYHDLMETLISLQAALKKQTNVKQQTPNMNNRKKINKSRSGVRFLGQAVHGSI